ncbi:MAG TPA: sigma-70 family RNA polymerase sigma factor [Pseudorhodoferax sp.]|nr:sigma-70 family RNA polymerase sigma factor [Pseudorhodoferax sp.]
MLTAPPSRKPDPAAAPRSLAGLYARWRAPLARLLRRRLGRNALAEEATQDVFLRMLVARKQLQEDEERPYLYRVARSVSTDDWRRQGGHEALVTVPQVPGAEDWAPATQPGAPCPSDIVAQRQRIDRLQQALDELPERQREAFLLNRIDGLSHEEVAAAMGISTRMVAKHLSRALAYCALRVRYASLDQMQQLHAGHGSGPERP